MLLPYTTLEYYGPGAMAAKLTGGGGITAGIKGKARAGATLAGSGTVTNADMTMGKAMHATLAGAGTLSASPKAKARMAALISIGALPSATDIAQAVWGASKNINLVPNTTIEALRNSSSAGDPWASVLEGGYTAADMLRLLVSIAQGDATGLEDGSPKFLALDGSTVRVQATYVDGVRTITMRNAT